MIVIVVLTVVVPCLVIGIRLLMHALAPRSYGPAGSPALFSDLTNAMASLGFLVAAAFGATAGATDLGEGVFRQLVVTGRSRVALYLARIPAGLSILLTSAAMGFAVICLVTSFAGVPNPARVQMNGTSVPVGLDRAQLHQWLLRNPAQAQLVGIGEIGPGGGIVTFGPGPGSRGPITPAEIRQIDARVNKDIGGIYSQYTLSEATQANPAINEMVKIGAWLELELAIGFLVGLGLGSLTGQRTVSTIVIIALELIITPILASTVIPYFINGQRLIVGLAMDQLRPIALASVNGGRGGPGRVVFGGHAALNIPPMPTWAMISVIVGWIVVWSALGAWRMATRDA
jgi:hypothetical protein